MRTHSTTPFHSYLSYDDDWAVTAVTQRDVTNVALRGLSWRARRDVTWRFFDVHDVTGRGCLRRLSSAWWRRAALTARRLY